MPFVQMVMITVANIFFWRALPMSTCLYFLPSPYLKPVRSVSLLFYGWEKQPPKAVKLGS